MPRELVIGNGSLLATFDSHYRLADLYFPHVGMENQAGSRFRFGVWCDGRQHWVDGPAWQKTLTYLRDTLVTDVLCQNDEAGLRLRCYDTVDVDANVLLRKIVVRNQRAEHRELKLVFHQDFNLYGNTAGDTAMFDPGTSSIIHYKSKRYVLINVATESSTGIAEYACGQSGGNGAEGTWRDADDGVLSMSAIAQGSVDSTIAVPIAVDGNGSTTVLYWICAGRRYGEVQRLDQRVRAEGAQRAMARTASYWYAWVNKPAGDIADLPDEIADFYRRSLLVIRTHVDEGGAILAANDSDIESGHNDHYSYMWARDATFVCDAMDRAGFPEITRRFLLFANRVIKDEGYFLHKYNPDGSLASLWHPWVRDGKSQLPIQEDETALVVWLIGRHYERTRDLELIRSIYQRLVIAPADFLIGYRDPATGLPRPSFDLWEERQGVFTFTSSAVYAALRSAAELANLFNDQQRRSTYSAVADEIRDAMVKHLWLEREGRFARGLLVKGDGLEVDPTVDASMFATFYLGVFPASSAMVEGTMKAIREQLRIESAAGGIARYENDPYLRAGDSVRLPGNPWIICTLWLAEHHIARASNAADLESALDLVRWARSKASTSLILPEQISPDDGRPLSVAPFNWSHAQVVSVINGYLDTLRALRVANSEKPARNQVQIDVDNP